MKKRVAEITIDVKEGIYDFLEDPEKAGERYTKYVWEVKMPKEYVVKGLRPSGASLFFDTALNDAKRFITDSMNSFRRAKKFPYVEEVEL